LTQATFELPRKVAEVFAPERGAVQYRGLWGGRGSGKSFGAAKMAAVWGATERLRILCTREFQVSIKESFHAELKAAIASEPYLESHYKVGVDYIRGSSETEFIFRGLRHNTTSIKSLAQIDLTIVEEAEDVPEDSWLALEATVLRQPKSEIWAIWNPRLDGSPVDNRFRKNPPENAIIRRCSWNESKFFPSGLNLLRLREQERLDPATHAHIWDGEYLTNSDSQVLAGKVRIAEFEPEADWNGPYCGGDFGFSQDPTAAVKCWIHNARLYVEHEAVKVGLELDDTAQFVKDGVPGFDLETSRWDCSRPESISHIKRHGLPRAVACDKWAGSVEDGISYLRSFAEIIVHPRCTSAVSETRLYSYKIDRLSGDITSTIVDAHNHTIDAIRYALGPMIKHKRQPLAETKALAF
jgi:phage terminase large subunit